MIGRTLGHYRILEQIGAGGMGVVFRAHDESLDRDVALKVLPPSSFSDPAARARLLREARSAASLNHPHICTIHEVGEADGQAFIAMELVEGQSLSARLAAGALPPEQMLRYGVQVAEALGHAHERGIVHRDLKSANVLISAQGRAKVLDFGLAKRMRGDELDEVTRSQPSLTSPGTLVGTLAYMAPEQLRGQQADARSDVWALGVVLFEMASGERPFQGQTGFELSSAILNQRPTGLPGNIAVELRAVIERCLDKEPAQRYQRGSEVQAALEAIQAGAVPPWLSLRLRLVRRRWLIVTALFLAVLTAAVMINLDALQTRFLGSASATKIESLAVLPFENLSGDAAQDYFADGITDGLITDLSRLGALRRVIPRGSVKIFKGTNKPLSEIAQALKVEGLITGTVLRSGNRVRVTVQLIHPATGEQLWANRYDRDLRDVLSLQNEILSRIAAQIKLKLTRQEEARLTTANPVNPAAHDAVLNARFHWYKQTPADLDAAMKYLDLALENDPNYAPAHAAIAEVWLSRGHLGFMPPREAFPNGKAAALKAIELDDSSAEAHFALGSTLAYYEWDWTWAEREIRRAIEINPKSPDAHFLYAYFLSAMKRPEQALAEMERCLELDRFNPFYQQWYGYLLIRLRRYDQGISYFQRMIETAPDVRYVHSGLWFAFDRKQMYEKAFEHAKQSFATRGQREVEVALARGYAEAGYPQAMRRAARALVAQSRQTYVLPVRIAQLYSLAGEKDWALKWLENAYQDHDTLLIYLNVEPVWDDLRSEPRFKDLLRRMNFPL